MAINKIRNVIYIDAPDTGVAIPDRAFVRISAVVVVGGAAAANLKIYATQSAVAAKQIFEGTAPIGESRGYALLGSEDTPGIFHSDDGLYVELTGTGAKAFIYTA